MSRALVDGKPGLPGPGERVMPADTTCKPGVLPMLGSAERQRGRRFPPPWPWLPPASSQMSDPSSHDPGSSECEAQSRGLLVFPTTCGCTGVKTPISLLWKLGPAPWPFGEVNLGDGKFEWGAWQWK